EGAGWRPGGADALGDGIGAIQLAVEGAVYPERLGVDPEVAAHDEREPHGAERRPQAAAQSRPGEAGGGGKRRGAREGAEGDALARHGGLALLGEGRRHSAESARGGEQTGGS